MRIVHNICIPLTPSEEPSTTPSVAPSTTPSEVPSITPSEVPSTTPSEVPSTTPSEAPTATPAPTVAPTKALAEINVTISENDIETKTKEELNKIADEAIEKAINVNVAEGMLYSGDKNTIDMSLKVGVGIGVQMKNIIDRHFILP